MSYSFTSRVRYSETGEDERLTLPAMLDYFQDCCTFQVDSIRQGHKELWKRNRMWVLSAWQVIVDRYPEEGETIITTTLPYRLHGFTGLRNFLMETESGERLASANSQWTFLDTRSGLPVRLTEEDLRGYVTDDPLEVEFEPRKIPVPKVMTARESFVVQPHHLDANHHVNNCQYVRLAMDYLPEGAEVHRMRVEYRKQGLLGDEFCPQTGQENGRTVVRIAGTEGEAYVVAEFQ